MANLAGCTIAFDLDGTLVDSAPDLHTALNKVLAAEGLPPASLEDARRFVGQGARALIVRAFAVHKIHPEPKKLDALTERLHRRLRRRHLLALEDLSRRRDGASTRSPPPAPCSASAPTSAPTCRSACSRRSTSSCVRRHRRSGRGRAPQASSGSFHRRRPRREGRSGSRADGRGFVQRRELRQGRRRPGRRLRAWLYGHRAGAFGRRRGV